jgi:hypothetical protein
VKKDELIKKAAERGITIDETQAEKYINLSDEQLTAVAGGAGTPPTFGEVEYENGGVEINNPDFAAMICGEWSADPEYPSSTHNCWSCFYRVNYKPGSMTCGNSEVIRLVLFARNV